MHKRHEIQVLRRAEQTWSEIAALSGVSEKTARRVVAEDPVTTVDNARERAGADRWAAHRRPRPIATPSLQALTEDPGLRSVALLHRARLAGYTGGKSAVYALAQTLRVRTSRR